MSSAATIGLVAGLLALGVAIAWILLADSRVGDQEDQLTDTERAEWQDKLDALGDDFGLKATRAAAGKWGASAAAILGVLATVAVVAGPSELADDVGGTEAQIAAVLVLLAGGLAALATLLAGLAEQGSPVAKSRMTPGKLHALTRERARRAAAQIRWSRILTAIALSFIVAAAGVAWLTALTGPSDDKTGSPALVVDDSGAHCGKLTRQKDGTVAVAQSGKTVLAIAKGADVTLPGSCPK